MGRSRESVRENKAMQSILRGETPEKRIFVSMADKPTKKRGDIKSHLTDIMAEARVPWFCPDCNKVMKRKLDDKMWRIYGHCFNCQITIENKLRITGEYDDWADKKILKNQKSYLLEQIQSISDWKDQDDITFLNQTNPDGSGVTKETWKVDKKKNMKIAKEAIDNLSELVSKIDEKLVNLENKYL